MSVCLSLSHTLFFFYLRKIFALNCYILSDAEVNSPIRVYMFVVKDFFILRKTVCVNVCINIDLSLSVRNLPYIGKFYKDKQKKNICKVSIAEYKHIFPSKSNIFNDCIE